MIRHWLSFVVVVTSAPGGIAIFGVLLLALAERSCGAPATSHSCLLEQGGLLLILLQYYIAGFMALATVATAYYFAPSHKRIATFATLALGCVISWSMAPNATTAITAMICGSIATFIALVIQRSGAQQCLPADGPAAAARRQVHG